MSKSGLLITFEGGEGAGKTTLVNGLSAFLEQKGYSVLRTRAPGGTGAGLAIRELLLHSEHHHLTGRCELFLFLADRAQHVKEVISPALQEGRIVLCDRFNDSTVAYQSYGRGFPCEEVEAFCQFATSGVEPDLTFYLDIDPKIGLARAQRLAGKDRIESETLLFHEKIRNGFLEIAKKHQQRIRQLDATLPSEEVQELASKVLQDVLFSHR